MLIKYEYIFNYLLLHIYCVIFQSKFGYACKICDRLWFEGDLKKLIDDSVEFEPTFIKMFSLLPCGLKHTPFLLEVITSIQCFFVCK